MCYVDFFFTAGKGKEETCKSNILFFFFFKLSVISTLPTVHPTSCWAPLFWKTLEYTPNNRQTTSNPIPVTKSGSRSSDANSPMKLLETSDHTQWWPFMAFQRAAKSGNQLHGSPIAREITPQSPWIDARLSLRHADNLCSSLCTFQMRIKIQWRLLAPLPVIMQSALFSVCTTIFERKLRNGAESSLGEYVHCPCLPLARQELKRYSKISLNTSKNRI